MRLAALAFDLARQQALEPFERPEEITARLQSCEPDEHRLILADEKLDDAPFTQLGFPFNPLGGRLKGFSLQEGALRRRRGANGLYQPLRVSRADRHHLTPNAKRGRLDAVGGSLQEHVFEGTARSGRQRAALGSG